MAKKRQTDHGPESQEELYRSGGTPEGTFGLDQEQNQRNQEPTNTSNDPENRDIEVDEGRQQSAETYRSADDAGVVGAGGALETFSQENADPQKRDIAAAETDSTLGEPLTDTPPSTDDAPVDATVVSGEEGTGTTDKEQFVGADVEANIFIDFNGNGIYTPYPKPRGWNRDRRLLLNGRNIEHVHDTPEGGWCYRGM